MGDNVFGINPGLRWRERIVAESHPIGPPSVGGELKLGRLHSPAADGAVEQLPAAEALELRDLHHPETIFIVHVGVDPLHGNPAAAFDAERPLIGHLVHPLVDGCDATIAFGFLFGVGLS